MAEGYLAQLEGLIDDLHKRRQLALGFQREEREARLQQMLRDIQAEQLGITREQLGVTKGRFGLELSKAEREAAAEEERRGLFPEPPSFEEILAPERGQPVPPGPAMSPEALRVRRGARAGLFTPAGTERLLALGEESFVEGERAGLLKGKVEAAQKLSDFTALEGARASKKDFIDYARAKFGDATADSLAGSWDKFTDDTLLALANVFPAELRAITLVKGGLMQAAKEQDPGERLSLLATIDENIVQAMKTLEGSKDDALKSFATGRINAMISLRDQVAGSVGVTGGPGTTLAPGTPPLLFGKRGFKEVPPPSPPTPPPAPQADNNGAVNRLMQKDDPIAEFQRNRRNLQALGFDVNYIEQEIVMRLKSGRRPVAEQFLDIPRAFERFLAPGEIFGMPGP